MTGWFEVCIKQADSTSDEHWLPLPARCDASTSLLAYGVLLHCYMAVIGFIFQSVQAVWGAFQYITAIGPITSIVCCPSGRVGYKEAKIRNQ